MSAVRISRPYMPVPLPRSEASIRTSGCSLRKPAAQRSISALIWSLPQPPSTPESFADAGAATASVAAPSATPASTAKPVSETVVMKVFMLMPSSVQLLQFGLDLRRIQRDEDAAVGDDLLPLAAQHEAHELL